MFPALFPVHKTALSEVSPGAETPGTAKSAGDGEKKEQFARLLFVSHTENASEAGQPPTERYLIEPGVFREIPFAFEAFLGTERNEGEPSVPGPEQEALLAAMLGGPVLPVLPSETPEGVAGTAEVPGATVEESRAHPMLSLKSDESVQFFSDENEEARPNPAERGAYRVKEGAVPDEILRRMRLSPQTETERSLPSSEIETPPSVKSPSPDIRSTVFPGAASPVDPAGDPQRQAKVAAPLLSPRVEQATTTDEKNGTASSPHLFSLAMTDNIRPRRNIAFAGAVVEPSETSESKAASAARASIPHLSAMRGELANSVAALAAVSSNAPQHALKALAEAELSTNNLPGGGEEELNLFPETRSLFGEGGEGKPTQSSQRIPKDNFLLPDRARAKDDFVSAVGKENADDVSSLAASRTFQPQVRPSALAELPMQTPLQGRGGAAIEDGVQHVVRFLKSEGRHAASIIVDPPALGRIEVELVTTAKGVEASIKVGSEQIRQLVQDHITVLRNHLEQQGVHLGEFVVDLRDNTKGNSGRNAFSGEGNARRRAVSSVENEDMEDSIPFFRMDLEHGLLAWVA